VETAPPANTRLAVLLPLLEGQDPARLEELEARYERNGNDEKRFLEEYFGVIEHRFRVDADPHGIYGRWREAGIATQGLALALEEIVAGRYSAYYFFDGVIRPNVFAPEAYLARTESALHEKVHLVQPSIYRALGLRCSWRESRDVCVRSLEPVAVYLTEFAVLKRQSPDRSDESINRAIARHLAEEAERCGLGRPVPRCPIPEQAMDYVVLPLQLTEEVARHGIEDGIRRFVRGLASPALASGCAEVCGS
jgi:hypothetical protein